MTAERPTSHLAEGDNTLADKLRALGLARKADGTDAKPTPGSAERGSPFHRNAFIRGLAATLKADDTPEVRELGETLLRDHGLHLETR